MRILLHPEGDGAGAQPTAAELKADMVKLRDELAALKAAGTSTHAAEIEALKKDLADTKAKLEAAEAREKKASPPAAEARRGWPW